MSTPADVARAIAHLIEVAAACPQVAVISFWHNELDNSLNVSVSGTPLDKPPAKRGL